MTKKMIRFCKGKALLEAKKMIREINRMFRRAEDGVDTAHKIEQLLNA